MPCPTQVRLSLPRVSRDTRVQGRYERMRMAGESHNMAEVLALRAFPGTKTDREFNLGRTNGNQFEGCPVLGDFYRAEAEKSGVSVTGKFYMASLADYPGDPTAWVSDRSDVLRVARDKGYKVTGQVEYEPPGYRDYEPPDLTQRGVADDILAAEVDAVMALDGGFRREDVAESVVELRSGAVDINEPIVNDNRPDDGIQWS